MLKKFFIDEVRIMTLTSSKEIVFYILCRFDFISEYGAQCTDAFGSISALHHRY